MIQHIIEMITHWFVKASPYLVGVLFLQQFLKEVFGVSMLGKKIYKGAPGVWKRIMLQSTFRKEVTDTLKDIKNELTINGGQSLKDAVIRIEKNMEIQTEELKSLRGGVEFNALRIDLRDAADDRMVFKMDKDGGCTFINDAFLKFFGYTEKDMLGFSWESIIHQEDLPSVQEKWRRAIETKSNFWSEQRICDRDGRCYDCLVRAWPIIDPASHDLKLFYGICQVKEFFLDNINKEL